MTTEKTNCPYCGKEYTEKGVKIHISRIHAVTANGTKSDDIIAVDGTEHVTMTDTGLVVQTAGTTTANKGWSDSLTVHGTVTIPKEEKPSLVQRIKEWFRGLRKK